MLGSINLNYTRTLSTCIFKSTIDVQNAKFIIKVNEVPMETQENETPIKLKSNCGCANPELLFYNTREEPGYRAYRVFCKMCRKKGPKVIYQVGVPVVKSKEALKRCAALWNLGI